MYCPGVAHHEEGTSRHHRPHVRRQLADRGVRPRAKRSSNARTRIKPSDRWKPRPHGRAARSWNGHQARVNCSSLMPPTRSSRVRARTDRHSREGLLRRTNKRKGPAPACVVCQARRSSVNFREPANVGYRPFTNETGLAAPYVRRRVKALTEAARKSVGGLAERLAEGGLDVSHWRTSHPSWRHEQLD